MPAVTTFQFNIGLSQAVDVLVAGSPAFTVLHTTSPGLPVYP